MAKPRGPAASGALLAALIAGVAAGRGAAQEPATPAAVEAEERLLREARRRAAEVAAAADLEDERLDAAIAAAASRIREAEMRTAALRRTSDRMKAAKGAAESRSAARRAFEAELSEALERVARYAAERARQEGNARPADAVLPAVDVPIARRLAQAFHALDRRDPSATTVAVARALRDGAPGRRLVVGAVVVYFVPDAAGAAPVFERSGRPVPASFAANVRRAADVAERRAEPTVLRLPLEPSP